MPASNNKRIVMVVRGALVLIEAKYHYSEAGEVGQPIALYSV